MTIDFSSTESERGTPRWQAVMELLSSMRFAISLLTIICIASVIGTVLKQNEPSGNYINQFGPFWAEVFASLKLHSVYSAWWFLLILAFLVISTSLCIARNTPKILTDLKSYKENIREQSLKAFHHKAEGVLNETPEAAAHRLGQLLATGGWKVKLQSRDTAQGQGWMIAAKTGAANKLGYIAAHSAIVLVCVGGLLDGDLMVRAQMWFGGKAIYNGGGLIADVPAQHRLSERNPAFRGNLMVAENTASSTAILSQSDGILLQELPFTVELKKFIVEYYSTGMPKLFASDIVIHDKATGAKQDARVEVNHPANYKGIEIYQSSFDDGGSTVKLQAVPMSAATAPFDVEGVIGSSTDLSNGKDKMRLEFTGLRVINVENMAGSAAQGVDVRKVDLRSAIDQRMGAGHKTSETKELRNVGPSVSYKLRDGAGQAREYNNYMAPVDTGDGVPVFLLGMRENPSEPYRYLRPPADENGELTGFIRLRAALADAALRERAVQRYALKAVDPQRPDLSRQLADSAARALGLFAGLEKVKGQQVAGLQALSDFLETNVPEAERARAGEMFVRILNGALLELDTVAREQTRAKPLPSDKIQGFMAQSVLALSDAPFYPAPMTFMLKDFKHVQASVFQVARAPGKNVVYLGCLFLILGVFAMLYVRERRLWVWLSAQGDGAHASLALSSNRQTMDLDREFDQLATRLLGRPESMK
ncbi:cytochrome C biogenesis protein ResB [Limnohabitans sp. MMS-10A-160]|uniref:cytochrome c biogenesis protein ResB n=1 Tax=unclassified Limnohabitans TaxID=2626134 RepID=UPI000D3D190A|nr:MULTISPECIES: cytochrome c biogenesis protein ResB [unclassified Limnohabitans]PUE18202.1 cytochrome C biogenesis protein ResB [Limnohabitans sp. MMS-10A-192]PUE27513.1 cytochrome C biogenesis protein ResB [Limnohabitans sp. MMS-10A-160]